MSRITTLAALLLLSVCAVAQINRPTTKTTSSAPPSTSPSRSEAQPAPATGDGPIAVKQANGIEIKLMSVVGNAADQQVTLNWIMNNPKANTETRFATAYAVDPGGDEYNDRDGGGHSVLILYTDVPKKGARALRGVPSKVDMLRLFKFDFWTQATGQWTVVEFRNLKIDWK
jgi:hypothetical protein